VLVFRLEWVLVVIFIYNEWENVEVVVVWLWVVVFFVDVLVVDDNLFDGIGDLVDELVVVDA